LSLLESIYARSPVAIQNAMATAYGIRERLVRNGGEYRMFCRELEAQQWWPADQLADLQAARLRRMVTFAAENVPYYRDLFSAHHIDPRSIRQPADLEQIPYLDKETVQHEGARLMPDRVRVRHLAQTTGGTTGRPVPYFTSPACVQFNYAAYETRFRAWAGVKFGDRMASIHGKPIVPIAQSAPPFWRHNLAFNQLYVSAYHLSDANLPAIVARIAAFEPRVVVAYTTTVHRVARYMLENDALGRIRPHAVMVSSETLFDWMREDIERAFGCKVFNGYSLGEPVCFVSECPYGSMHISPEYGVIELAGDPDTDGSREVIATGLINDAMPFLRYRTGDRAIPSDGKACACGRLLPTLGGIVGRVDDSILTPEGVAVGPTALGLAFKVVPHLRESQIVQRDPSRITIKAVVTPEYVDADARVLLREMRARLGNTIAIDLEYVDAIVRTSGGKQRLVVSSIGARRDRVPEGL
jgi:phenylacetate-CoA ligase